LKLPRTVVAARQIWGREDGGHYQRMQQNTSTFYAQFAVTYPVSKYTSTVDNMVEGFHVSMLHINHSETRSDPLGGPHGLPVTRQELWFVMCRQYTLYTFIYIPSSWYLLFASFHLSHFVYAHLMRSNTLS